MIAGFVGVLLVWVTIRLLGRWRAKPVDNEAYPPITFGSLLHVAFVYAGCATAFWLFISYYF